MQKEKYHRHFGVYGICEENGELLVIEKNRGPYKNRYDLPGGSLEEGESLTDAIIREIKEETSLEVAIVSQVGLNDFLFPCQWKEYTHVHHIAAYFLVGKVGGEILPPKSFSGQDSNGARFVKLEQLTSENSSPLVHTAVKFLSESGFVFSSSRLEKWIVK